MCAQMAQNYEVKAGLEKLSAFSVVGISAMISGNETASEEINTLWETFFSQSIGQDIENRLDDVIYAVYSDYQGDHTQPYRLTIGYRIQGDPKTKDYLHHIEVKDADYAMMSASGEQPKALMETWTAIWQSDLDRRYETDFEVYGQRFFEEGVHEVLVAVGLNLSEES